jgi:hypothetical protein
MRELDVRQTDLFAPDDASDLFDEERPARHISADPDKVRQELLLMLAHLKAAESLPWPKAETRYHQTVFPQMARWLPEDEAAQLCFVFDTELRRLLAA